MLIIIPLSTHPRHTHTPKYHSANFDVKHINATISQQHLTLSIALSTDTASLGTHEAEVHQPVDLLGRLVVVEIVELCALQ